MNAKVIEKCGHGWTLFDSRGQDDRKKVKSAARDGRLLIFAITDDCKEVKRAAMDGRFLILAVRTTAKVTK